MKDRASIKDRACIEEAILEAVRKRKPSTPLELVTTVFTEQGIENVQLTREALRSLVAKGLLQLTRNLEVQIPNARANGNGRNHKVP